MRNIGDHRTLIGVAGLMLAGAGAAPGHAQILTLSVTDALFDLDARVTLDSGRITVLDGRVTTAVAGLTATTRMLAATLAVAADVTALGGRMGAAETAIATTAQAVAGLDIRTTAQGNAIVALDGRVTDNSAAIDRERVRNDQQDRELASHSLRIDAVGAVASTALADTRTLRSDVAAGRVGIVQVGAGEAITVGAMQGGTSVSVAGTGGTRRISGISAGGQADDAATVGQPAGAVASTLGAANLYTDQSIQRAMDQQMGTTRSLIADNTVLLRRDMNGVAAHGAALSGLPQSMIPGKGFAGVSMGGKGGEVAIALGASKAFVGEHAPVLRAGAAIDTRRGDMTYNAGVGFHF